MGNGDMEPKIIEKWFSKFEKAANKWFEFIDISFLPDEMRERYKEIIVEKLETLKR